MQSLLSLKPGIPSFGEAWVVNCRMTIPQAWTVYRVYREEILEARLKQWPTCQSSWKSNFDIYIIIYIYIYIYTCRHRYTYINTYLHKSTRTHIHITFHSILFHYTICIFHLTFLYSKTHYFRWHDMTWHGMTWHTYTRHRYRHTCICTYICTYVCVSYIHARIHTHSMPEVIWHINLSIRGACSYVVTVTGRLWHPLASQVMMNGKAMQTGGLKVRAKATAREIIGRSWHKVPESLLGSSLHSLGTHSH